MIAKNDPELDAMNVLHRSSPSEVSEDSATESRSSSSEGGHVLTPDMAGFRLLKLTNLMSRPFFGQFAKQHSLTLNEWRSIVVLANRPGSAAQDVSAATGSHPMNISRAVIALRKRGLVEEARDPDNHRRMLLWLTPTGKDLFKSIAPHSEAQNKLLFDVLTQEELAAFIRTLEKLTSRAEMITHDDLAPEI
ncbi:MarR family winged helix-turn-helix transcriptional regulator [Hydrogenophaga sp.]|uniref:MarR family winged helix-turn-helix transcriptional regulator n=1 Tax=Hydrogenophaga sp. TaxID=1904254 RepID=UPI0027349333|nr:MarR family winged helix-turn-helix transcriptional regulator [Hydrogenophaga sp.]MDP3887658.1 MarR family winged helix-turn-helix transcriptional regulator [Hydrogenophaga sp.]MDZ4324597.1 MarR family winged helix-turn-helix transcriptional regulator [Pseudomonas sp.]